MPDDGLDPVDPEPPPPEPLPDVGLLGVSYVTGLAMVWLTPEGLTTSTSSAAAGGAMTVSDDGALSVAMVVG